ncbi:MAG: hypothetical protein MZW92_38955 [Comamonadaceae bacterium]|nr:hypothetical protein [Comamonadaceae bacterium]
MFALFKLNPAPFCLLDEVDAPLDDANTERFCELVQLDDRRATHAVPVHHAQQDRDGDGRAADRRDDAGAGRVAHRGGRHRQRACGSRPRPPERARDAGHDRPAPRAARRRPCVLLVAAVRLQQVAGAAGAKRPARGCASGVGDALLGEPAGAPARPGASSRRPDVEPRLGALPRRAAPADDAPSRGDLEAPPRRPARLPRLDRGPDARLRARAALRARGRRRGGASTRARRCCGSTAALPVHLVAWDARAEQWVRARPLRLLQRAAGVDRSWPIAARRPGRHRGVALHRGRRSRWRSRSTPTSMPPECRWLRRARRARRRCRARSTCRSA